MLPAAKPQTMHADDYIKVLKEPFADQRPSYPALMLNGTRHQYPTNELWYLDFTSTHTMKIRYTQFSRPEPAGDEKAELSHQILQERTCRPVTAYQPAQYSEPDKIYQITERTTRNLDRELRESVKTEIFLGTGQKRQWHGIIPELQQPARPNCIDRLYTDDSHTANTVAVTSEWAGRAAAFLEKAVITIGLRDAFPVVVFVGSQDYAAIRQSINDMRGQIAAVHTPVVATTHLPDDTALVIGSGKSFEVDLNHNVWTGTAKRPHGPPEPDLAYRTVFGNVVANRPYGALKITDTYLWR